jgi:hypothetical protein
MPHAKGLWSATPALIALFACGSSGDVAHQFAEPPIDSYSMSVLHVRIDGNDEPLNGATVSRDFFKTAQVRPLIGRFFVDGDYRTKTPSVVVLNQGLWQRLHGAPHVIGTALTVNDQEVTVIGVAERGFAVPKAAQLWLPRTEPSGVPVPRLEARVGDPQLNRLMRRMAFELRVGRVLDGNEERQAPAGHDAQVAERKPDLQH